MKIYVEELRPMLEMANVCGKYVKTDVINFSFYFSTKAEVNHDIRAKIRWNREKLKTTDGYMELFGEYEYYSSNNAEVIPKQDDIQEAKGFFRKYKVLFAAVWEYKLEQQIVQDYLRGMISSSDVIEAFEDIGDDNLNILRNAESWSEVEHLVRVNNMFNLHD